MIMEKWQRDAVDKHMELLCEQTTFCPAFLDCLQSNKLIGSDESPEFERIKKHEEYGHYKCNQHLYNVLKTRCRAYDILIDLLKEYNQPELAGILENERSAKLEDSPVLAEGHEPTCEVPGGTSGTTRLKRPHNISFAGSSWSHKSRKLLFDLQDPTPLFVGRKQELADLHKLLNESNRRAVITHITSVSGLGGIGKTQLARKYAQDYIDQYDNNIAWVSAENEESITSSFLKLASDKLSISTKNANGEEKNIKVIVGDCYEYFESRKWKCLFIFDNMEKEKYLQKFLPKKDTSQFIYLLITSRQQDWGNIRVIGVDAFSEEEAIEFVKNGLEIENRLLDDDIRCLVHRLQYFPLAICQAVSYILNEQKMDKYSIVTYLDDFDKNTGLLLDCDLSDELEIDYTKTTFTTWKMTIEKIAQVPKYGHLAVKILHLVAYFSADDIHRDTFCELDECSGEEVNNAVRLLISYSMVSGQENQSIISIHRLVQEVIRIELCRTGKENEAIEMGLQLAEKCLCEKFIPHAISLWKYAEGVPELVWKFVDLATRIIQTLRNVGRYYEACQFGVNSLEKLKSSDLVNQLSILKFEACLGQVFRLAGNYETSLFHLESVEEGCKTLANIDKFLLGVQEQIAYVFGRQGRYSEALELGVKMCERSKLIFGEGHLRTASSLFMTAPLARKMGKYDLAYSTYQDGFKCFEKATEKNEVSFLTARHNFAILVADRGNINEAISILEDINAKIIANPGINAPFNLRTNALKSLGIYLNATNRHIEAHKICEELYEEEKSVLGEDHENTLKTLISLGSSLLYMKKYEEAYLACNTAYLKLKEKLGSESIWTLEAQRFCADVLSLQGQHDTAISLMTTIVKTRERTMDLKSIDVLDSKHSYAGILARANKCEEAIAVLEELKETYFQLFGAEHPDYLDCVEFIKKINLGGSELRDYLS